MTKKLMLIVAVFAVCGIGLRAECEQNKLVAAVVNSTASFCRSLDFFDKKNGQFIGYVSYSVDPNSMTAWVGLLWIYEAYRKTGLGKLLAILGFADLVTRFSSVAKIAWRAVDMGGMTGEGLRSFYSNLGGVCTNTCDGGVDFELDVRQMKEKNSLFDFNKMAAYARDGATFTFNPSGAAPSYYEVGANGKRVLKSRL